MKLHVLNEKIIYPALAKYILEYCEGSMNVFADDADLTHSAVSRWLYGTGSPSKEAIDAVLALTGMTYEEAFRRE